MWTKVWKLHLRQILFCPHFIEKKGVYKAHFRHSCKSFLYILLDYVLTQWVLTCFFLSCYTNRILHSNVGVKSIEKYNLFCITTLSLSCYVFMFHDFYWIALFTENPKAISKFSKNGVRRKFANQFKTFRTNFVHTWVPTYFFSSRAACVFSI